MLEPESILALSLLIADVFHLEYFYSLSIPLYQVLPDGQAFREMRFRQAF